MKSNNRLSLQALLLCGAAGASLIAGSAAAEEINIEPQPLVSALNAFGVQTGQPVISTPELTGSKTSPGVRDTADPAIALTQLLAGTGLSYRCSGDTYLIVPGPQAGPAPVRCVVQGGAGATSDGGAEVEALIVTAQKREEDIQDVPIAISAFTEKQLEAQKIEGGFDLVKAVPNVAFTKTNFTSYNFQIRGVGTQSISATSDPGVAVAFNNTAILQNRLFEQEYLDIERVEVLRGPQGTLYGRNATAGVINVISAKPRLGRYEAQIKGEIGNYDALRLRGMVNVPIGETFAVRAAAAWTDREGYTFNSGTGRRVDGRDLWTGRLSVAWEPTSRLRADAIWEHFEENDDRLRTGKQLCHRDAGPTMVGDTPVYVDDPNSSFNAEFGLLRPALFSQGCLPGSLYSKGAFDTPNGVALPFIFSAIGLGNTAETGNCTSIQSSVGNDPVENRCVGILQTRDPYGGKRQSENLREIESVRDPHYRAEADLFELNVEFDVTDTLRFVSQTAYVEDETFSFQDFNRFNTEPVFQDTSTLFVATGSTVPSEYRPLAPGGIFCDPQIGCTDRLAGFDIAQASAEQFSQEFRLQSDFSGPLNFSLGANYTRFEALIDYYVMYNVLTAQAFLWPFTATYGPDAVDVTDASMCPFQGVNGVWVNLFGITPVAVPRSDPTSSCPYIDPNPVSLTENFEGEGHNYFRSKNPYDLKSTAVFGELYWNIRDDLKITAGLRYTDDKKTFSVVPSQVLLAPSIAAGGATPKGYPETGKIKQRWGEWTGRLVLDWKPALDFTNDTLIYGSFSRGYKGGGANPPTPGFATAEELIALGCDPTNPSTGFFLCGNLPILRLTANEYDSTFEPEFINAYEVGTKNTLLGGALTLNATGFYYDYTDYQVSQIRDRTAVNENFDAEMWGLELETLFAPSEDWRILANIGYLNTRIADGETSIDIMNRTQDNPDYVLVKPWMQLPSNCVIPREVAETYLQTRVGVYAWWNLCGGVGGPLGAFFPRPVDPNFGGAPYDVRNYDGTNGTANLNGGAGILADLSGNELPNSPHWTVNVGSQYTFHLPNAWDLVVRGDAYWQSQSYHRVYNTEPYDKLRGWYNANLVVWAENEDLGLHIEAYVKNLLDHDPITGAFLNSDDTGLTTNVFMLDPRLYGFSVRKSF